MLKFYDIPDQLEEDDGQVLNQFYNDDRVYHEPIPNLGVDDEYMTSINDFTRPVLRYTQHQIDDFCKSLRQTRIEPIYSKYKKRKQRDETAFESAEPTMKKRKTSKVTPSVRIEERTPEAIRQEVPMKLSEKQKVAEAGKDKSKARLKGASSSTARPKTRITIYEGTRVTRNVGTQTRSASQRVGTLFTSPQFC